MGLADVRLVLKRPYAPGEAVPLPETGKRVGRVARREVGLLIGLFVVAGGVWSFVEVTDEVLERQARPVDETILLAMREPHRTDDPWGPAWLEGAMRDTTALGSITALAFLVIALLGFLLLQKHLRTAALLVVTVAGGAGLAFSLKAIFERPRPDLVPHGTEVTTWSFPSGHALLSAVVYLTLASLVVRVVQRPEVKVYVMLVAVVLTVAVGVSRVYMGVHWPSDVLAGWTLGAAWAVLVWVVARLLQWRGRGEGRGAESPAGGPPVDAAKR